jgi:CheY-like chemotaxis protein
MQHKVQQTMDAQSKPGLGMPVAAFPATDGTATNVTRVQEQILVIDDEASVRVIAQRMLQHFGYQVQCAEDGETGLQMVQSLQPELCLVLVDLTMPQMSGHIVVQLIKAQWPHLPVMLMSGYSAAELTSLAPGLGIDGVLQKPFTLVSLRAALEQVLR